MRRASMVLVYWPKVPLTWRPCASKRAVVSTPAKFVWLKKL
jgi:hypothetical protein